MTAPEGANPWSRTPSSSNDTTYNSPPTHVSPYDDAYVYQATVEEASASQPMTFAPTEPYDDENVSPFPQTNPYEEMDLADEIDAALSPLLTIVEPETVAETAPYENFGEAPAVEHATYPTEIEQFSDF